MPGQQQTRSVWEFPRPPAIEACGRRVRVELGAVTVADSRAALQVLETSQAPAIYIPAMDVRTELLVPSDRRTLCEWKGTASYLHVEAGGARAPDAAWLYAKPDAAYVAIAGHISFYPQRMSACWLDDELISPNGGDFYGGWISRDLEGPFKGAPGTAGW